ncbi:MAG TPA: hypothetical protein VIU41_03665 [Geobacteraceae bacterium]
MNRYLCTAMLTALLCLGPAAGWQAPAWAAAAVDGELLAADDERAPITVVTAEVQTTDQPGELATVTTGSAGLGYRFVHVNGQGGLAAQYDYLHPSLTGSFSFASLGATRKVTLDGNYLNDKDYLGDLVYDEQGKVRVHARTESLFHNLATERLLAEPLILFGTTSPQQSDLGTRYGVRVEQDLVEGRLKPFPYPLHFNLGYWRLVREGESQFRFADHGFGTAANDPLPDNRLVARLRPAALETHEGRIGVDAHLGYLDLVYQFQIRQFYDDNAAPADPFIARSTRAAGVMPHNLNLSNRFLSHTVKLHSSLTGGLVGAASYTYGRRDLLGDTPTMEGAAASSQTLHNLAGDLTYTPVANMTMAIKYRHQDVDVDGPASIVSQLAIPPTPLTYPFGNPAGALLVRTAPDTRLDQVTVTANYRPLPLLTVIGEYRGDFLHRSGSGTSPMGWSLPDDTATHRGSISLASRPFKGMRLKALYRYTTTDQPAYGVTPQEQHHGEALATYTAVNNWGVTASYRTDWGWNNDQALTTRSLAGEQVVRYLLPRDRTSHITTAGVWLTPVPRWTLSAGYNFLRLDVDQTTLLSGITPGVAAPGTFSSQNQYYTVSSAYQATDELNLALTFSQSRSTTEFTPQFVVGGGGDSSGIRDISRHRLVETSFGARADYRFSRHFSCTTSYGITDYTDKTDTSNNGTVQTVAVAMSANW